jgi:hypothetical protein
MMLLEIIKILGGILNDEGVDILSLFLRQFIEL